MCSAPLEKSSYEHVPVCFIQRPKCRVEKNESIFPHLTLFCLSDRFPSYGSASLLYSMYHILHRVLPPPPHPPSLQSADQLQAGLPSDQVHNNTVSPSRCAAVNHVGCGTSLKFTLPQPLQGSLLRARTLHQTQSGGPVMRSKSTLV